MNKKRRKCLMVIHRFYPFMGGAERLFLRWAQEIEKLGYAVDVFTTNVWDNDFFHYPDRRYVKERTSRLGNINIRRFRISHPPNKNNLLKLFSKLPSTYLKQVIGLPYIFLPGYCLYMSFISKLKRKYDFIIGGVFPHYYLMYPALMYAKRKKIPFICVPLMHFGQPNSSENFELFFNNRSKEILKNSNLILTETGMERESLIKHGFDGNKIETAGIGLDPAKTAGGKGERFREKYNIGEPMVLQISTQTHDKGSHHVVEAMKVLWQQGIEAKLVLIGQILRDFEDYLLGQGPEVFKNTIILNYIAEQEKKDALDACDIFAMASKSESFGLTYPEAWMYRKPVIGAFCSGVMELIEEGINGYLIPFGDKAMLAEYIKKLLDDKNLRKQMGQNGYNKVMEEYTWEKRIKEFNKIIREISGEQ
ncbi:MAG: glycosyltransferase family 4 protein [Actinomycetota bacterium]